jgi:hypothetical protein
MVVLEAGKVNCRFSEPVSSSRDERHIDFIYDTKLVVDGAHSVSAVQDSYEEIHVDGSAFAAVPVAKPTEATPFTLEVDDIIDIVATSTSLVLNWIAHRTGRWGATTVIAGLVVPRP